MTIRQLSNWALEAATSPDAINIAEALERWVDAEDDAARARAKNAEFSAEFTAALIAHACAQL